MSKEQDVCKGAVALGTGCKRCAKCAVELAEIVANLQAAKPADALGSLPVVAYELPYGEDGDSFLDWAHHYPEPPAVRLELTDHAQATAEIAKRDALCDMLAAELKLIYQGERIGLYSEALATYEAAQGDKQ